MHAATRVAQQRHFWHELQAVTRQRDFALHLAAIHVQRGQMQMKLEPSLARGFAAIQNMSSQRRQGGGLHHFQYFVERAMGLGGNFHIGLIPVGHACLRLFHHDGGMTQKALGLAHRHGVAVKHQLARQARQGRPGLFTGAEQVVRHKLVVHIVHLRADVEFALSGLFKRYVVQLALDAEVHRTGLP